MTYPTIMPAITLDFANSQQLDPRVTFSRASGATYINSSGLIASAADHEPRFDHDPVTGECLGLLVEEARANTMVNSDLSGLTNYGCSTAASTEVNPEGAASCKRILAASGFSSPGHRITKTSSGTSADTTMSAFVKMDTHPYVLIGSGGQGSGYTAAFNIDPAFTGNRLLGQSGVGTRTNIGAGYENYPNGWFRIWASGTTTGSDGWSLAISPDADTLTITNWNAAGTEAIFAHGGQREVGVQFPSSYIPTSGSTVTRSADIAQMTGDNFSSWYNQGEGSFIATADRKGLPSLQFTVLTTNGSRLPEFTFRSSGTAAIYSPAIGSYTTPGSVLKATFGWSFDGTGASRAINGAGASVANTSIADTNTALYLGNYLNNATLYRLNGHISRLSYYNQRLTDAELQTITL